ncbi:unnamed protein product [Litomosoides sigmodontis]|uniref:Uncharacterized protein n=1 Tax=Litomosoides sigmodontis TaxID=42156 RepID=A0A3P6SN21_LITSI|nr:unnamed protein product [Litomosoides sigmodontis]
MYIYTRACIRVLKITVPPLTFTYICTVARFADAQKPTSNVSYIGTASRASVVGRVKRVGKSSIIVSNCLLSVNLSR